MQDLRLSLFKRTFTHCALLLCAACYLTGCCGSGTNTTTTTTNTGGGGTPSSIGPVFVVVTPDGKFVYAADPGANSVAQYKISSSGALVALSPAKVTGLSKPSAIAISPNSQFAYVANQGSNTVSLFKIGTTGALTPISPATVTVKGKPSRLVTVSDVSDSLSNVLYVAHTGGIDFFEINSSGSLTSLGSNTTLGPVKDLAVGFDGDSDYVLHILTSSSHTVTEAGINFDGSLDVQPNKFQTGTQPAALVNSQAESAVFAMNQGANSISIFPANDGEISASSSASVVPVGSAPVSGADVEGDGTDVLVVVNSGSNTISSFSYDNSPSPTTLQALGTVPTGISPAWVAVSPDIGNGATFVYVANQSGSISQYQFNFNGPLIPLSPASVPG